MKNNQIQFIKNIAFTTLALSISSCGDAPTKKLKEKTKPNIIYILADDLGYGDLSCYGQKKISTPNIDQLAQSGMQFTQHYSGSTVSAPSRSALMTGQHTGHTPIRGNKEAKPIGQYPMGAEAITVAEVLKKAGYTTGAFGKWGLGFPGSEGDPNMQGFDEFFGYNCQRNGHHYYPWYLFHNQEKIILEKNEGTKTGTYAPELIHEHVLDFIENNKDTSFFLYVPSIIPHAELLAPEKYMEKFRGKFLPEKKYEGVDSGERFRKGAYCSQDEPHAAFAAMITLLDEQVGEIVQKIKDLGLEKNTIIIFSSDNGPHLEAGADPDYFDSNGNLKGYKRDLYEGGIRVPMIVSWPGVVKNNTTNEHISAFWDILPTFADIAGSEIPADIDGISLLPTLTGNNDKQKQHEYLYWEFYEKGGKIAVRKENWKAVYFRDSDKFELYDLSTDLGEENDIAEKHPEIIEKMKKIIDKSHTESSVWPTK